MPAQVPLLNAKIEVLSSGRSNILGVNYAELTAYDEALNAAKVPNPAADPFRELVDWLNQNAIPTPTANQSSITTNLIGQQGSWNDVTLKEAGCQPMNDSSIGLDQFHMEFSGNGCGMGYISFPHPATLDFPPEPENIGGPNYTGSADAPLSSGANSGVLRLSRPSFPSITTQTPAARDPSLLTENWGPLSGLLGYRMQPHSRLHRLR